MSSFFPAPPLPSVTLHPCLWVSIMVLLILPGGVCHSLVTSLGCGLPWSVGSAQTLSFFLCRIGIINVLALRVALIDIKSPECYLAYSKCSINSGYYYYCSCYYLHPPSPACVGTGQVCQSVTLCLSRRDLPDLTKWFPGVFCGYQN